MTVDRIESVLQLHGRSDIDILLARYLSPSEAGGDGGPTAGSVNIKRLYGRPADFRVVVRAMAGTVPSATGAIGSADVDSMPLATAVAWTLGLPAVYVRDEPRQHLVELRGFGGARRGIADRRTARARDRGARRRRQGHDAGKRQSGLLRSIGAPGLIVDEMSVVLGGAPEEQLVQLAASLSLTILHVLVRR